MNNFTQAGKYLINVWDEVSPNWRNSPDHVQKKFLEAEKSNFNGFTINELFIDAKEKNAKISLHYVDYGDNVWTVPFNNYGEDLLEDKSIDKIRIEYDF